MSSLSRQLASLTANSPILAASATQKPSILHAASAASDIPLTLLRDRAVSSLSKIKDFANLDNDVPLTSALSTILSPGSLNYDPARSDSETVNSTNNKISQLLRTLLGLGIPSLSNTNTQLCTNFLNVIEYLIRRYDIHRGGSSSSKAARDETIRLMLPMHDSIYFRRFISLCGDDGLSNGVYGFLRGYGVGGGKQTKQVSDTAGGGVKFELLCQQGGEEYLRLMLDAVETCATVYYITSGLSARQKLDGGALLTTIPTTTPPPGFTKATSFYSFIVLRSLRAISSKSSTSSLPEGLIRTILPSIVRMVSYRVDVKGDGGEGGNRNLPYNPTPHLTFSPYSYTPYHTSTPPHLAYLLLSTLATITPLSPSVKEVATLAIVEGAVECQKEAFLNRVDTKECLDQGCDALLGVIGVVVGGSKHDPDGSNLLPLKTFKILRKWNLLPVAMSSLLNSDDVLPPIVSFFFAFLHRCCDVLLLDPKGGGRIRALIEVLCKEDNLKKLWNAESNSLTLIEDGVRRLITGLNANFVEGNSTERGVRENIERVLESFLGVDKRGVERGCAHIINSLSSPHDSLLAFVEALIPSSALSLSHPSPQRRLSAVSRLTDAHTLWEVFLEEEDVSVCITAGEKLLEHDGARHVDGIVSCLVSGLERWGLAGSSEEGGKGNFFSNRFRRLKKERKKKKKLEGSRKEDDSGSSTNKNKFSRCVSASEIDDLVKLNIIALKLCRNVSDEKISQLVTRHLSTSPAKDAPHLVPFTTASKSDFFTDKHQSTIGDAATEAGVRVSSWEGWSERGRWGLLMNYDEVTASPSSSQNPSLTMETETETSLKKLKVSEIRDLLSDRFGSTLTKGVVKGKLIETYLSLQSNLFETNTTSNVAGSSDKNESNSEDDKTSLFLSLLSSPNLTKPQLNFLKNAFMQLPLHRQNNHQIHTSLLLLSSPTTHSKFTVPVISGVFADSADEGVTQFLCLANIHEDELVSQRAVNIAELLISGENTDLNKPLPSVVFVQALSLLRSPHRQVRVAALSFLSTYSTYSRHENQENSKFFCQMASMASTGDRMEFENDPTSALPRFICQTFSTINEKKRKVLRQVLLDVVCSSISVCERTAANLLFAFEVAGGSDDNLFPLTQRWDICGLKGFEKISSEASPDEKLLEVTIRMLRGIAGDGSGTVELGMSDRSSNKRGRSYSVSDANYVFPLPTSMYECISRSLSRVENRRDALRDGVISQVIERVSWGRNVFERVDESVKMEIADKLLVLKTTVGVGAAGNAFLGLPLNIGIVLRLLENTPADDLARIAMLADYVKGSYQDVVGSGAKECDQVIRAMFGFLADVTADDDNADSIEYCKYCIMDALLSVCTQKTNNSSKPSKQYQKTFSDYASLLVSNIKDNLTSSRSRSVALKLLSRCCYLSPSSVAKILLHAIQVMSVGEGVDDTATITQTAEAFNAIVPAYCRSGKIAGVSLITLLTTFVDQFGEITPFLRTTFYNSVVNSLIAVKKHSAVGPVVVCLISKVSSEEGINMVDFCSGLMQRAPTSEQVHGMLHLLKYTTKLLDHLSNRPTEDEDDEDQDQDEDEKQESTSNSNLAHIDMSISLDELLTLNDNGDKKKLMFTTASLINLVRKHLSAEKTKIILQHTKSAQNSFLELFGGFLHLSTEHQQKGLFWDEVPNVAMDCVLSILELLSMPNFLSAVKLIITAANDVSPRLRRNILILLGERVSSVNANDTESILNVELIGELVEIVKSSGDFFVKQAGVIGIERLAKNLQLRNGEEAAFLPALSMSIEVYASGEEQLQAVCSLCIGELLRRLGLRALPSLSKLMETVLDGELQRSAVMVLLSVSDNLGNFLGPYLKRLISADVLFDDGNDGGHYDGDGDDGDVEMNKNSENDSISARLLVSLAKNVKTRILLEHYAGTIKTMIQQKCYRSLAKCLKFFQMAIDYSTRADLTPFINNVAEGLFSAYDGVVEDENEDLLVTVNAAFLSVVMKGSEKQLKKLFAKLHFWSEEDKSEYKSYVFWSASCELSRELRGIFLGCLSVCFDEGVSLLNAGRKRLGDSNGKKRKRAGQTETKYLRVLLNTLTHCFRSDGEGGGHFVRVDEGRRYFSALKELGGLLKTGCGGSDLVDCLCALVIAVGEEKYWKSLSHYLIEVVGGDNLDLKVLGLDLLTAVLTALGEEYVVLLPELLPCLSECLEDVKQVEIMKKARGIIEIAEKLSGESFSTYL